MTTHGAEEFEAGAFKAEEREAAAEQRVPSRFTPATPTDWFRMR